jgi:hypothetical protein
MSNFLHSKKLINTIFLLVLIVILYVLISHTNPLEGFRLFEHFVPPKVFGNIDPYIFPLNECRPENNCFPGSYARTEIYQNVCQPRHGLLRQKKPLVDDCQRTFSGFMETPQNYYVCDLDDHLQRRCRWIKKKNLFNDHLYVR